MTVAVSSSYLTGYGILDNELHVQVRYADILETDNHGRIYLKNENGEAEKAASPLVIRRMNAVTVK